LELTTLLSPYLLAAQGDRMAMAHGVEGRFPFLDHRLFELAAAMPSRTKLPRLSEKDVLRRWARDLVPPPVLDRPKQPYRAPDVPTFFGPEAPDWVGHLLDPSEIRKRGVFDPRAVSGLVRRCRAGKATGFRENQALVAVLSTQLWHTELVERSRTVPPLPLSGARVVLRSPAVEPTGADRTTGATVADTV
jgi:asparagine synthase (glutamine-hydrolysing)